MATLILRGGGVIEGVGASLETVRRARDRGDEWLSLTYQPGYTPHNPESFKLHVLVSEIIGIKVDGR